MSTKSGGDTNKGYSLERDLKVLFAVCLVAVTALFMLLAYFSQLSLKVALTIYLGLFIFICSYFLKIYGRIVKLGKTSVIIEIEARRHSVYNGTQKLVCKCEMVFVRIDGDGEAVPIAPHVREKLGESTNET